MNKEQEDILIKELCNWSGESERYWLKYFELNPKENNFKDIIKLILDYVEEHSYSDGYHEGFTDGKTYRNAQTYAIIQVYNEYEEITGIKIHKVVKTDTEAIAWIADKTKLRSDIIEIRRKVDNSNIRKFKAIDSKNYYRLYYAQQRGKAELIKEMIALGHKVELLVSLGVEDAPILDKESDLYNLFYYKIPEENV